VAKLLQWLHEAMRDDTREWHCAALRALGLRAEMSNRGRPEERVTSWRGRSLGIIDISPGPITWVNLKKNSGSGWESEWGPTLVFRFEYGILDSRVGPALPRVRVHTVRVRSRPLFGEYIHLRWKGQDFGLGLIDQLGADASLRQPVLHNFDLEIGAYPGLLGCCWLLTVRTEYAPFVPSAQTWDCLQSIACHLMATRVPYKP